MFSMVNGSFIYPCWTGTACCNLTDVLSVFFCFLPWLDLWVVNSGVVSWYLDYWWQGFSLYGLKIGDYCIPGSSFSIQDKAASSVCQISSGLARGSSNNPSWGFVQWSKVSRQQWKGREPSGVGRRVAGLKTSQVDIVRTGFFHTLYLISEAPLIRHP